MVVVVVVAVMGKIMIVMEVLMMEVLVMMVVMMATEGRSGGRVQHLSRRAVHDGHGRVAGAFGHALVLELWRLQGVHLRGGGGCCS